MALKFIIWPTQHYWILSLLWKSTALKKANNQNRQRNSNSLENSFEKFAMVSCISSQNKELAETSFGYWPYKKWCIEKSHLIKWKSIRSSIKTCWCKSCNCNLCPSRFGRRCASILEEGVIEALIHFSSCSQITVWVTFQ